MRLPVLNTQEGAPLEKSTCQGKDNCPSCSLFVKNPHGRCQGCTPAHKEKMADEFKWCYQQCNECTGHKVRVPAICCRSPMKDIFMTAVTKGADNWNKPEYKYTKRPALSFKQKAIYYVSSGGVNTITAGGKSLVPDGTEVVAVNISRVWGGNGFYSRDLKDYLHLPPKTKLLLMTMCLDDLLERGWSKEFYADYEDYQRVGIDAWMPLSFSSYPEEANMHQYYQTLRTLYCTEASKAWWVTADHKLPLVQTDDLILEAVARIPQMVFNTQFVTDDRSFKYALRTIEHYHKLVDKNVSFWFVGASSPTFVHNVRKQSGLRDLYFMSAKPLYLASKGQALQLAGTSLPDKQSNKLDLSNENFKTFAKMVKSYG